MLVYDVTNKISFESLDSWLHEFAAGGGKNAVVVVVANKVWNGIICFLVYQYKGNLQHTTQ